MPGGEVHAGPGMKDVDRGNEEFDERRELLPGQSATLTAPPKRAQPQPNDLAPKLVERHAVAGHRVIIEIPLDHALQGLISQLNTRPACAPVNASMAASRQTTHDSGSGWRVRPFLYDSFIRDSMPVYPGARVIRVLPVQRIPFEYRSGATRPN